MELETNILHLGKMNRILLPKPLLDLDIDSLFIIDLVIVPISHLEVNDTL